MAPQPSMDLPSSFADPLSSFLLSHSTAAEDAGELEPALHVTVKGTLVRNSSQSPPQVLQLAVVLQPLQLHYQPSCFARLSNILASPTGKSRTAELMDVISAHDSEAVESLSLAELACTSQPVPAVSLEVVPPWMQSCCQSIRLEAEKQKCLVKESVSAVMQSLLGSAQARFGMSRCKSTTENGPEIRLCAKQVLGIRCILGEGLATENSSGMQLTVSARPIRLSCWESVSSRSASTLLQEMRRCILQENDGWRTVYSQVCTIPLNNNMVLICVRAPLLSIAVVHVSPIKESSAQYTALHHRA